MENTIKSICEDLQKEGDITNINYTENGFEVSIKYVKLDFKMSEFRQSSSREAKIQVEMNESGEFITRFPQNAKAREFNERPWRRSKKTTMRIQPVLMKFRSKLLNHQRKEASF